MSFIKRFGLLIAINMFIVFMASILASVLAQVFGIQGEWPFYIIFYSIIGFGGAFFSLFISKWVAKKFMGVKIIDPHKAQGIERKLIDITYEMSVHARLPKKPEVGIFDSADVNAFATGPSKKNSLVAVSTAAINKLDDEELRGVIGHEVAHIANGDMVTMTLLMGLMNTMVLLAARLVARLIASMQRERSYIMETIIFIALQVVFGILASIALNYFSRKREYRADAGGAKLAGSENMIKALKALKRMYSPELLNASASNSSGYGRGSRQSDNYRYLQISGQQKSSIFSTHPSLDSRIERLERRGYISSS